MIVRLGGLFIWLALALSPMDSLAAESRPRSILVLYQSDQRGSFYHEILVALRDEVSRGVPAHVTLYAESLDLSRFGGEEYEKVLRNFLKEKYRDRAIGAVVTVGDAALELALRWRGELWPGVPVVFTLLNEFDLKGLKPPSDVTGHVVDLRFADSVRVAQAVVPDLKRIFLVGEAWERQYVFRGWKHEIAAGNAGIDVTELIGLTMNETRRRVADLPADSAIVFSAMRSDGEGTYYSSSIALSLIAEKANRPIVVAAENLLSPNGIGGYTLLPGVLGEEAGKLALRILGGESARDIPRQTTGAVKPIFNWRQMQRWGVRESDLPRGSEIRFREPSFWERYRWQSLAIAAVLLIQAALISILLRERRKRNAAEAEARSRLSELAHVGRQATAGELSSSIAHELNQPLGAILTNAETAELILKSPHPDLAELREILADIRRDDQRASDVITRMRNFLKRTPFEIRELDLNDVMREAFAFLAVQASARNVALYYEACSEALPIRGDAVQLQQVILNIVVNSMEAMLAMPYGRAVIGHAELDGGTSATVSISDSGPGIPPDKLREVFDPFFTTKKDGMGVGLSIARTIIQIHKGRIWAENHPEGGAVFHLSLPLTAH
jgi:signal transduction histidine kinase/ABC-type uncharacterized transport system substrate-binding protein